MHHFRKSALFLVCAVFLLTQTGADLRAVIFYNTDSTSYNTTEPTGALAGSGWQWVGLWTGFQGTPVGPHHFLTAKHVGGAVGQTFTLNGQTYTVVRFQDDGTSDLRLCEVRETFTSWAEIYRGSAEVGKGLVVFGRGLTRGAEVRDVGTATLRGWQWGGTRGTLRWGQNTVAALRNNTSMGQQLYSVFDATGGTNECHLTLGDSSGPVFVQDAGVWKLAGIASLVDGQFNTTNSGAGFNAAIFDSRGLYLGNSSNWQYISSALPVPSGFYATRVSVKASWIDTVLAAPLTATVTLGNLNQTYDGTPRAASVTVAPSGLTYSVTYGGSATVPVNAGSYTVVATVTSAGYTGSASGTLVVAKADQSVDFPVIADRALNESPFTPPASATSGLPVTISFVSGPATVANNEVTLTGAGTVVLRASQAGDGNFNAATAVDRSFVVTEVPVPTAQSVPATPVWAQGLTAGLVLTTALRALAKSVNG